MFAEGACGPVYTTHSTVTVVRVILMSCTAAGGSPAACRAPAATVGGERCTERPDRQQRADRK